MSRKQSSEPIGHWSRSLKLDTKASQIRPKTLEIQPNNSTNPTKSITNTANKTLQTPPTALKIHTKTPQIQPKTQEIKLTHYKPNQKH